jgi:hypothetical protein
MEPAQRGTSGIKWWLIGAVLFVLSALVPISCINTSDNGTFVFSFGSVSVNTVVKEDGGRATKVRTGPAALRPD